MENIVVKPTKKICKITFGISVLLLIPLLIALGILINNFVAETQKDAINDIFGWVISFAGIGLFIVGLITGNVIAYCIIKNEVCILTEDRIIVKYKQKIKAEILYSNVKKCVCGFSTMIYCKQPYICNGCNKGATAYLLYLTERDNELLQSKITRSEERRVGKECL